jgi:7-carboxy-7-deazaguanine synthase
MTPEQVLDRVRSMGGKMVELTGGEPLLQKETIGLADSLLAGGYRVLIETSGERFLGDLARAVVKIVDVKCPGSGESGKFNLANFDVLERKDQIKFVVLDERDYLYARDFMDTHHLDRLVDEIIFSPVFGQLPPLQLAEWVLRDDLEVRLGLQIHKFIWDPEARGV